MKAITDRTIFGAHINLFHISSLSSCHSVILYLNPSLECCILMANWCLFNFDLFLITHVHMYVCLCVSLSICECMYHQSPKEHVGFPGDGVTVGCEPLHMGTGNQTCNDWAISQAPILMHFKTTFSFLNFWQTVNILDSKSDYSLRKRDILCVMLSNWLKMGMKQSKLYAQYHANILFF